MADRISTFRTIRLSIHPSPLGGGPAEWALSVAATTGGVPRGQVLMRGRLHDLGTDPTVPEIWDAIWSIADMHCAAAGFEEWPEAPAPPDGGHGGESETPLPGL